MASTETIPVFGMVQVDVFWSYALGASLALAASRQIRKRHAEGRASITPDSRAEDRPARADGYASPWENPYLLKTVLFLSLIFVPSGVYLLWAFPSWETMHVADRSMPAWLVAAFVLTNVTQGILGFWIVERLLPKGRSYLAYLQTVAAYFLMFFILVHGWDGRGYQRFFSVTKADFLTWDSGNITSWLTSDVALTLLVMGIAMLPTLFWMQSRWLTAGYRIGGLYSPARRRTPGGPGVVGLFALTIFGVALGSAIGASVMVHLLGWVIGLAAFAIAAWLVGLRKGGLVHRLYGLFALEDVSSQEAKPQTSGDLVTAA